jgi:hypothetical protein
MAMKKNPAPKKPAVKRPGTTPVPKSTPMPYKPSTRKPDVEKMPYKPSTRGGTSGNPIPSEESRRPGQPSVDDKIYRTMPITEPQLKQIKKMYGIE